MSLIFNGANRTIQFDRDSLTHKTTIYGKTWYIIDTSEMYSEWKRWCVFGDGAQYPPAFSVLGGEDIGSGLRVGTYVFLLVTNGWILVCPNENDVTIQITGNLYPDIANYPVIVGYQTNNYSLIMRNSSLTQTASTSGGSGATPSEIWSYPNRTLSSLGVQNIKDGLATSGEIKEVKNDTSLIPALL